MECKSVALASYENNISFSILEYEELALEGESLLNIERDYETVH